MHSRAKSHSLGVKFLAFHFPNFDITPILMKRRLTSADLYSSAFSALPFAIAALRPAFIRGFARGVTQKYGLSLCARGDAALKSHGIHIHGMLTMYTALWTDVMHVWNLANAPLPWWCLPATKIKMLAQYHPYLRTFYYRKDLTVSAISYWKVWIIFSRERIVVISSYIEIHRRINYSDA